MKQLLSIALVSMVFIACNSEPEKKVLVMGRGELNIQDNNVVMKDGPGHAEKLMELEKDVAQISVDAESGKKTIDIPAEEGYYVLNLKKDTMVGSIQDLDAESNRDKVITQEALSVMIDSMQQLIMGANIKEGRNMIILPQEFKKVSANEDARVFGPYNKIPSKLDPSKNDKPLEIYKLWTNTQMRERIETFKKATINLEQ